MTVLAQNPSKIFKKFQKLKYSKIVNISKISSNLYPGTLTLKIFKKFGHPLG